MMWQDQAKCREMDEELFFDRWADVPRARRDAYAESLCRDCPVIAQCAAHVLETIPFGVVQAGVWSDKQLVTSKYPTKGRKSRDAQNHRKLAKIITQAKEKINV